MAQSQQPVGCMPSVLSHEHLPHLNSIMGLGSQRSGCLEGKSTQLHQRGALTSTGRTGTWRRLLTPGLFGATRMERSLRSSAISSSVLLLCSSACSMGSLSWSARTLLGSVPQVGFSCGCCWLDPKDCPVVAPGNLWRAPGGAPVLPLGGALLTQGLLGGLEVTLPPSCGFRGWFGAGF